jgi:hypothetical protein
VFTLFAVPAGDVHVVGEAFEPENESIFSLVAESVRGGELPATVTKYPLLALVDIETVWASTLGLPVDNEPNGIRVAVVNAPCVESIDAPFTVPDVTGERLNVKVGSTEAVTEIAEVERTAAATVVLSMATALPSFVIIRTKNEVFVVDGFVIFVIGTDTVVFETCVVGVATVRVIVPVE